jgi:hypothetical protein
VPIEEEEEEGGGGGIYIYIYIYIYCGIYIKYVGAVCNKFVGRLSSTLAT